MSINTARTKKCGVGVMFSIHEMNNIRHFKDVDNAVTKRRQKKFNKSPRRTKAGEPYTAYHRLRNSDCRFAKHTHYCEDGESWSVWL